MPSPADAHVAPPGLHARLFNRTVGLMLIRNTVVSSIAFGLGLLILWLLVERAHIGPVIAAAISFLVANSLHYAACRVWIFPGSDRALSAGYAYFLANSGFGLIVTVLLFAALIRWTAVHYMLARVVVSIVAGLMMFMLNAVFNFRRV